MILFLCYRYAYVENRNPRFDRFFAVTLHFDNYITSGRASSPSAYGASIEVSETAFNYLLENITLWEKGLPIKVSTSLNDIPASINSLYVRDEKFYISLKLLDSRSWYQ